MPDPAQVPEEAVEAVLAAELARTGEELVGADLIERRKGEIRRELRPALPAIEEKVREEQGRQLLEAEEALRSTEAEYARFRKHVTKELRGDTGKSTESLSWDELLGVALRNGNEAMKQADRAEKAEAERDQAAQQERERLREALKARSKEWRKPGQPPLPNTKRETAIYESGVADAYTGASMLAGSLSTSQVGEGLTVVEQIEQYIHEMKEAVGASQHGSAYNTGRADGAYFALGLLKGGEGEGA